MSWNGKRGVKGRVGSWANDGAINVNWTNIFIFYRFKLNPKSIKKWKFMKIQSRGSNNSRELKIKDSFKAIIARKLSTMWFIGYIVRCRLLQCMATYKCGDKMLHIEGLNTHNRNIRIKQSANGGFLLCFIILRCEKISHFVDKMLFYTVFCVEKNKLFWLSVFSVKNSINILKTLP